MAPMTELTMFVLAASRAMGIFAAPGWIGAEVLPIQFRAALAAAIGFALTPDLLHRGLAVPTTTDGLVGGIAWNLALGLVFGFAISLLWSAAEMAGSIAELAVGLNPAGILGAGGGPSATSLGQIYPLMLALLFFGGGGLEQWIHALGDSFATIPLTGSLPARPGLAVVAMVGRLVGVALTLAAPVLLSLFVVNLTLAVAGRLTAQNALYMAALPAELGTALIAVTITVAVTLALEGRLLGGLGEIIGSARQLVVP